MIHSVIRRQRGQASILIATMMLTFMLFFAFVVNVGMLVHAKINLQNAADMAAYAGAATQARQLNQISYLNYEMRRQYKKFLFRYAVMGTLAQKSFPAPGGQGPAGGERSYSTDGDPNKNFGVPVVCVIFNASDNFCQLSELRAVGIPTSSPLDQINQTLRAQLSSLEAIRQNNCKAIGALNKTLLYYWLFNSDPELTQVSASLADGGNPDDLANLQRIRGLVFGLGIVPKLLILRNRIDSLERYVNSAPQKSVNLAAVNQLRGSIDPAARERTIQAFSSAFQTLGEHVFADVDAISMDELMPSQILSLNTVTTGFDTYYQDFEFVSSGGGAVNGTDPSDCRGIPIPLTIPRDILPIAVTKNPAVLTYYAIRLQAQAKLLFNPFGPTLRMKAYSAAQPFGSRIGKIPAATEFSVTGSNNLATAPDAVGLVPNLLLGDANTTIGPNSAAVQSELFGRFRASGGSANQGELAIGVDSMQRAYHAAMLPNPNELNDYNIPSDTNDDPFVKYFTAVSPSPAAPGLRETFAFWAPVITPDRLASGDSIATLLREQLGEFSQAARPNTGPQSNAANFNEDFTNILVGAMDSYSGAMGQGRGEDGEGFNVVRLRNPLLNPADFQPIQASAITRTNTDLKTSWNDVRDVALAQRGRIGYSVKFVSFNTLRTKNQTTNGNAVWNNNLDLDTESEADMAFLKH